MNFEFSTASRIVFGRGAAPKAAADMRNMGTRALFITGRDAERSAVLTDRLRTEALNLEFFKVEKEPTMEIVCEARARGLSFAADMVIAVGGGSVIDTGKAVAALLANSGDILDYLEVVGQGLPLSQPGLPFAAVPTTAGTGTEVTRNAVIGVPTHKVKVSMRSPFMLPHLAVVDPLLTVSMSPRTTAAVGLDALTQVIEPYLSHQFNPLTDALCKEGMARAARSLKAAFQQGDNLDAREDMSLTALFGGLALANAKLGAVHGFAGPLGGMFDAPHGEICGILLPHVLATLVNALRDRAPQSVALSRLDTVAEILTGEKDARAMDGVRWIRDLTLTLNLPNLGDLGIQTADIPAIVAQAEQASSMKGSPIVFTDNELRGILSAALVCQPQL